MQLYDKRLSKVLEHYFEDDFGDKTIWSEVLRKILYVIDSLFLQEMEFNIFHAQFVLLFQINFAYSDFFFSPITPSSPQKCTVLLEILDRYSSEIVLSRHIWTLNVI